MHAYAFYLQSSANTVVLSRVLIPFLCLAVWGCIYFEARLTYRYPRSMRKTVTQLAYVAAATCTFILQINLIEVLTPRDAHSGYFFVFVLLECGVGLTLLFMTLQRERARSTRTVLGAPGTGRQER
ncbi:MAG TPA: hypothetical protein VGN16_10415 [Acidobacteriaceae bacterium]|jgi:hypothetical protein